MRRKKTRALFRRYVFIRGCVLYNKFILTNLGTGITANVDLDASLGLELSLTAPEVTMVQEVKKMKSNNKGNFMKNVKGGIMALLEQLVVDSNPSE